MPAGQEVSQQCFKSSPGQLFNWQQLFYSVSPRGTGRRGHRCRRGAPVPLPAGAAWVKVRPAVGRPRANQEVLALWRLLEDPQGSCPPPPQEAAWCGAASTQQAVTSVSVVPGIGARPGGHGDLAQHWSCHPVHQLLHLMGRPWQVTRCQPDGHGQPGTARVCEDKPGYHSLPFLPGDTCGLWLCNTALRGRAGGSTWRGALAFALPDAGVRRGNRMSRPRRQQPRPGTREEPPPPLFHTGQTTPSARHCLPTES